jgi:hypothetical protein
MVSNEELLADERDKLIASVPRLDEGTSVSRRDAIVRRTSSSAAYLGRFAGTYSDEAALLLSDRRVEMEHDGGPRQAPARLSGAAQAWAA